MKKYDKGEQGFLAILGQNIKRLRILKGFTQQDVSALSNTEESRISRIEKGRTNPTITTLKRIADALKANVGDMFSGI